MRDEKRGRETGRRTEAELGKGEWETKREGEKQADRQRQS